jgi:hypothetical protein
MATVAPLAGEQPGPVQDVEDEGRESLGKLLSLGDRLGGGRFARVGQFEEGPEGIVGLGR